MKKNTIILVLYVVLVALGAAFFVLARFNGLSFNCYITTISILTLAFYVSERLVEVNLRGAKLVLAFWAAACPAGDPQASPAVAPVTVMQLVAELPGVNANSKVYHFRPCLGPTPARYLSDRKRPSPVRAKPTGAFLSGKIGGATMLAVLVPF
jgi:hypothetical protein